MEIPRPDESALSIAYHKLIKNPKSAVFLPNNEPSKDCVIPIHRLTGREGIHIYPGTFDPLRQAHIDVYKGIRSPSALDRKSIQAFEISLCHVYDPKVLSLTRIEKIVSQFRGRFNCILSNSPTIFGKIGLFRGFRRKTVHIGIFTAINIINAYKPLELQALDATVYVYPRKDAEGVTRTLQDFNHRELPTNFIPGTAGSFVV